MTRARDRSWLAVFLHTLAAPVLLAFYRVRVLGLENIPDSGGVVLAGNHASLADPAILWCLPSRPVHFMAKIELFKGLLGWALPRLSAFPVRRGRADTTAIKEATDLLSQGAIVGMFPEGTRHHEGQGEAHGGVAFIANRADVPIVPVGIHGTDRIKRSLVPPRVTVSFGPALDPSEFTEGGRKERVAALTARLMERIAEEVERAGAS